MADDSIARKTAIGATWLVAWRFVTRGFGVISTLALARILTPADFGIVAMATIFSSVVDSLSQLGLQDALVRHPKDGRALFDTAFTLQLFRALAIGAVLAASAPLASWWFNETRLIPVLLVLAALAAASGLENVGIAEFRREMRYDKQFALLLVPRLLQVAITIPLAFALQNYWALLIGIAVSRLARVVATYAVHPYRPKLRLAGWRELAGFSLWTWASSLAGVVWDRCDPVILGPVLGPAGLGLYLLAYETAILPVSELIAPAADALFAGFASAHKQASASTHTASSVAVTLLLGVAPLTIAISATSGYVVAALLGPKWQTAQPLIAILAWQCLFSPFSYVCTTLLVARGMVRLNFLGNVAAAAIRLLAILIVVSLTHRLDHIVLVITFIVAAEALIYIAMLRRAGDTGFRQIRGGLLRIALASAATVATGAVSGLGWQTVTMSALPALLHGVPIGCAVLAFFAVVDLLLWLLAGRPAGPETHLLDLVGQIVSLSSLRRKLHFS
jgi:O-antigen/teichoic acid export membrane protein